MPVTAMTGADTVTINNRILTELATDDCVLIKFPNEIASVKTGKNGNSIYAMNESGKQCDVEIHLVKGGLDDKFLNGQLSNQQNNFAAFPLLIGRFVKKIGDGTGKIVSDTYVLSGGIFTNQVDAKSNVAGDVDQSISIYKIRFSNSPRALT